jgi:hypothetical protein
MHYERVSSKWTGLGPGWRSGRAAKPLEAVEDQVEPELELVREVVSLLFSTVYGRK